MKDLFGHDETLVKEMVNLFFANDYDLLKSYEADGQKYDPTVLKLKIPWEEILMSNDEDELLLLFHKLKLA